VLSALALTRVPPLSDAGTGFAAVGYATVGALVASRRPGNAVGWLMLTVAVSLGVQVAAAAYVWTGSNPGYQWVAWVGAWVWYVWMGSLGVLLPLLFPDGRLLSPRWRVVPWLGVAAVSLGAVAIALMPGRMDIDPPVAVQNPVGLRGVPLHDFLVAERVAQVLFFSTVLAVAASLVVRYRRSDGGARQQIKWFAFAGVITLVGLVVGSLTKVILPGPAGDVITVVATVAFLARALAGIPVAIGLAILRYRLYDIDLVIRRTLVYGALTTALLATYVGLVLLLRLALSPLTGDSDLAVAVSTLAVAALFRPARRRIQTTVDRRFYRRRYDATRTVEEFSTRLRHHLDLDTVGADLCTAATDTVQPAHVSLWLRP
jgi:hypothetical protein